MLLLAAIALVILVAAALSLLLPMNKSSNFCSSEFSQQQRNACFESLAISSNNSTACAAFSGTGRDSCYSQIAARTKNQSICSSVSNYSSRYACVTQIANATVTYSSCSQLSEPYSDMCFYAVGTSHLIPPACSSIKNQSLSNTCSYSIDYDNAVTYRNASYCRSIGNGTTAQAIALLNAQQYSITNSSAGNLAIITDYYSSDLNITITPRDLCYYSLAYYGSDSAYCPSISNPTLAGLCKSSYSKPESNASIAAYYRNLSRLCPNSSTGSSTCSYTAIINAVYLKNATKCSTFNSTSSAICYSEFASYYSNSSYCQYIHNATLNGACVESVLYNKNAST